MDTQTTITLNMDNALAAMAFVVADQQRVIKQLQEELDEIHKGYKEMLDIDKQQYVDLDAQYQNLKKQYDAATDDFHRQASDFTRENKDQVEWIKRLETECNKMSEIIDRIPAWHHCRIEYDANGNKQLTGFESDGPVLLCFYVRADTGEFWDVFNHKQNPGHIAYMSMEVKDGLGQGDPYSVDPDKEIRYLSLSGYVSYQNDPD